jgi:Leucine Rich repeat
MFTKKPNAWFVLGAFIAGCATTIVGVVVYTGFVDSKNGSLSAMRAEHERLEESRVRLASEIEAAKRELGSLKSKRDSYRVQISKAEQDKQTARALLQLKVDYEKGTKKGTYIDASYVGAGQDSIKVVLKDNDGGVLDQPMNHPDSDKLFRIISRIEDLQSLTIRGLKLNRRDLDVIRDNVSIGYLELANADLTDESTKDLLEGKNLWGLNLSHNDVTVIPPCQAERLAILDFKDTQIGDEEVRRIAGRFPKAKHLNLSGTKVTDAGIHSLATLVDLEFLEFCDVNVGDSGVEPLSRLKNLKTLRIDKTKVSDPGLRILNDMDGLETVYVRSTGITDEGLNLLSRRPKLRRLNVEQTRISDDGLVKFCGQMKDQAEKIGDLTIMIDMQGRQSGIVELMHEACPKILVQALKE